MVGFFVVGALLFGVFTIVTDEPQTPITLSAGARAVLLSEFEMLTGRKANESEQARIFEDYYQRELLFQEGLQAELYRSDPGLRGQIIEGMQRRVTGEIPEPSAKALVNYYTDNIDRYYSEASISFTQRLFTQKPGNTSAILTEFEAGLAPGAATPWQGEVFPDYGISMIRGLLGQTLLETLEELPLGQWQGPFQSMDGWHYFKVEQRQAAKLLPFARVRDQVLADYQASTVAERVRNFVNEQRVQYPFLTPP